MNPLDDWPRVKLVLEGALACDAADRQAYLAEACGADTALRSQIERLLAIQNRAGTFLETPAAVVLEEPRPPRPILTERVVNSSRVPARMVALAVIAIATAGVILFVVSGSSGKPEHFPRSLAVFRDSSRALTANAIARRPVSDFRPIRPLHPNFGFTRDALWLRLVLQNPESTPQELVLDATREWVDEVDLFEVADSGVEPLFHSGAQVPLAQRPIATERIAFPLVLGPRSTHTYLVRLRGRSPLSFRGDVSTLPAFIRTERSDQLLFGGYYAVLWGAAAYSLLLFATLRDRTQLLVGILLAAYGLAEATSHGHVSRVFPVGAGWFELSGGAAAFSVFIWAFFALSRAVLNLSASPRLEKTLSIATWTLAGLAAVPVAFPALHLLTFVSLFVAAVIILATIFLSMQRDLTTLFFFLAVGSLLLPGTLTLAVLFGAMPAFPLIEYANHMGAVAMSCLFSLLVADAIRQQREKIGTLNRELVAGYAELRFQVAARSRELVNVLASSNGQITMARVRPGDNFEERYRVVSHLGDGAWGSVYEVIRLSDNRPLALKVVTRARSGAEAARVAREAEIGARLSHPHLVSIVDVGVARGGTPFLVMELIRGGSIEDHRERFGDVAWALPLLAGIARGLSALHRAHIVHRDLKPANVLLEGDGDRLTAKLADFGFALVHTLEDVVSDIDVMGMTPGANAIPDAIALTHASAIVGTPAYMAPEAVRGARLVGPPSDVFAFGMMACEMLTGREAFEEVPVRAVLAGKVPARKTIIEGSSIPPALASALDFCLALDPALRSSVDQVLAAFEASGVQ